MALPPFIADAFIVQQFNTFLGTNYRVEELQDWPDYQIEELQSAIAMLNIK